MDKPFQDLLLAYAYAQTQEEKEEIEGALWERFGRSRAVFVMDMSGFSLLSQRHGIVHYLSMVRRMQLTAQPIIEEYAGEVVKFEADNCFASFPDALPAVGAGMALNAAFSGINLLTPDELDIRISIGIDYGDILLLSHPDYYGDPVNCASKLGEDVAGPGEILVTDRAFRRIPPEAGIQGTPLTLSISGIQLETFKVRVPELPNPLEHPEILHDPGALDAILRAQTGERREERDEALPQTGCSAPGPRLEEPRRPLLDRCSEGSETNGQAEPIGP